MAADGQVVFEISADNRDLKSTLRETTSTIESESKKWDRAAADATTGIETSFGSMLKGIAAAFSAAKITQFLVGFGKDAINLASDLEEVQNVVDVTFGEGATQIETWAKAAGTQFGLTETQAKRFTSTLGAMMKSAGIAGPEIVNMSTDLAGLAADMASFYNMDFDTAFDKIRSGLTGQTEPLRALGINMSVANLEAFALEQGITKAFGAMSQGEQTMLRYQYLMQATADAQGDFARTSDGYANGLRALETNLDSLKTNLGKVLLPVASDIVSWLNDTVGLLTGANVDTTLMDKISAIETQHAQKIAEIEAIAAKARELSDLFTEIAGTDPGAVLEGIASGANALNSSSTATWESLLTALQDAGAIENANALVSALSGDGVDTDRATAWQTLLSTLSENAEALSSLTGTDAEGTRAWLDGIAESANSLDPNSAEGWNALLGELVSGLPGLQDTEGGRAFLGTVVEEIMAMGKENEEARRTLEALGMSSAEIDEAYARWLENCKGLVQEMPELNSIINTQTGEINGGKAALDGYINTIEQARKRGVWQSTVDQMRSAIAEEFSYVPKMELDVALAEKRARDNRKKIEEILRQYTPRTDQIEFSPEELLGMGMSMEQASAYIELTNDQAMLEAEATKTRDALASVNEQIKYATDAVQEYQAVVDEMGGSTESATRELTALELAATGDEAALAALSETLQTAIDAFSDLEKYTASVYDSVARSLESAVSGFDKIVTPAEKARSEMQALNAEMLNADAQRLEGLQKTFSDLNSSIPTIENMTAALEDQLQYLTDYQDAMDAARMAGISDEILASLSDGSVQSYDYLVALADATEDQAEKINTAYSDVATARDDLSETLTAQRLAADDEFTALLAAANDAVDGLDLYADAEAAMSNTVQGIADGIAAKIPEVQTQANNLLAALSSLNNIGFGEIAGSINYGGFSRVLSGSRGPKSTFTPHANGLDYVPFDNYLAALHEGESILTAEEARVWRDFKYGSQSSANNIDYEALGGVMRENVGRGNVYLDGQTVGRVISGQQANSYRALERSGWQG